MDIEDVAVLCEDLGIIKGDTEDGYDLCDKLYEKIDKDVDGFLVEYTKALLDHILYGSSNLTGKTEHYVGFGKRHEAYLEMFMKRKIDLD